MPTKVIAVGIDGTGSPEWRRRDGANSHVFRFITDINGVGNGNIESGVRSPAGSKKYFHGPNTRATDFSDIIDAAYQFVVSELERLVGEGCAESDIKLCLVGHSRGCVGVIKLANYLMNGVQRSPKASRVARKAFQEIEVVRADKLYVAVEPRPIPVKVGYLGLYDTVNRANESIDLSLPNVVAGSHARRQNRGHFLLFGGSRSTFGTVDIPSRFPTLDVDTAHGGVGGDPGYFTPLGQITKDYYCNARQLIMTREELIRAYGAHPSRKGGFEPNYQPLTGSDADERRARLVKSVREVVRADNYIRAGAVAAGFSLAAPASTISQYGASEYSLWRRMISAIGS